MARYFGFNPPFLVNGRILDYQEDDRLIKNDLIQLILTSPGERVMRPGFGTNVRKTLFNGITTGSMTSLRSNILEAIAKYEPRVTVNNLVILSNPEENKITIQIEAALNLEQNRELNFELDVQFDKPTPRPR